MKYFFPTLLLLIGCATARHTVPYAAQEVPAGKALVYIYRTSDTAVDSINPDPPRMFINDRSLGRLLLGGHYVMEVDPGEVDVVYKQSLFNIPMAWPTKHVKFKAEPNQHYYVKFAIVTIDRVLIFKQVDGLLGQREIRSTHLLEPISIFQSK